MRALPNLQETPVVYPQIAANLEHPAQQLDVGRRAFFQNPLDRGLH